MLLAINGVSMGRAIVVGDAKQSLYAFRGANSKAFERIKEMLARTGRPVAVRSLPVNFRCDHKIIENAQQWVPALQGFKKESGTVDGILFADAAVRANNHGTDIFLPDGLESQIRSLPIPGKEPVTFAFLCRINVPLVITAYHLIGLSKRVCIIGREQIGEPLKRLCTDLCGSRPFEDGYTDRISDLKDRDGRIVEEGLLSRLNNYLRVQTEKFREEEYKNKLEAIQQNTECLQVIAEKVMDDSVQSILKQIDTLFVDEPSPGIISLSTIHRSKGLEWDVVFILRPDLLPHPNATTAEDVQQEKNACYVAGTRPRHRLYYVADWPFGKSPGPVSCPFEPVMQPSAVQERTTISPQEMEALRAAAIANEGNPLMYGPGDHLDARDFKKPNFRSTPQEENFLHRYSSSQEAPKQEQDDGEPF
jgi:DNA helicase-2/ATP-dependent DNA helicase PcrA